MERQLAFAKAMGAFNGFRSIREVIYQGVVKSSGKSLISFLFAFFGYFKDFIRSYFIQTARW